MIKMLCPNCNSEDIFYKATIDNMEVFACDDCEDCYSINLLEWVEC